MQEHFIHKIPDDTHLDALFAHAIWETATSASIDRFPWYETGEKQTAHAKFLFNAYALFMEFVCKDKHISSRVIDLNARVDEDSSVGTFLCPQPDRSEEYFDIMINACGILRMGFGKDRFFRQLIDFDLAKDVKIHHSVPGILKDESPDDREWRIVAAVPFRVLSSLAQFEIRPVVGTRWTGNFCRCGGKTNRQYASWVPIDLPLPDFHCPTFFGDLIFT
ncbi:MAG: carbohydrate-binding family 9-like protein [Bacteroidota bacterium]|nr:carbohydrate-binding family 9-like protein [Bacteroidota bacterium]